MTPTSSSSLARFGLLPMWFAAMAWHLWRIGTGRPAFDRMSDSTPMAVSFAMVFFGAGLFRWSFVDDKHIASVVVALTVWMVLIVFAFERGHRSSSLAAALLGVSAAVDIAASVLALLGVTPVGGLAYSALEIVLMGLCVFRFAQCPKDVKSSGYQFRSGDLA